MNNVFFSIIVVCYNAEKYIESTINSILKQRFQNYEIIVKDGLSTDDTLKRIPKSDKIKVYSQQDTGIYDAMNQAIGFSNGKYICFLNCGDYFVHECVLEKIYMSINNFDNLIVYGDYSRKNVIFKQAKMVTDFYIYRNHLCHQTMFIAKKLFDEYGLYNLQYKITADYEHTLRCYFNGTVFVHSDTVVCDYLGDGASENEEGRLLKVEERENIISKYFTKYQRIIYFIILKLSFGKVRQKIISDTSPKCVRTLYRKIVNKING